MLFRFGLNHKKKQRTASLFDQLIWTVYEMIEITSATINHQLSLMTSELTVLTAIVQQITDAYILFLFAV